MCPLRSLLQLPLTTQISPSSVAPSKERVMESKVRLPDTAFLKPLVKKLSLSNTAPETCNVPFVIFAPEAIIAASPEPLTLSVLPARLILTPAGMVRGPFTSTKPVSSMTVFCLTASAKLSFGPTFVTSGAPPLVIAGIVSSPPSPSISSSVPLPIIIVEPSAPCSAIFGSAKAETVKMLRHRARIRTTEMSFDVAFISVLLLYRKIKSYEFEITSQRQIAPFSVVCQ